MTRLHLNASDILGGDLIDALFRQGVQGIRMDLRAGESQTNAVKIAMGTLTAARIGMHWSWLLHGGNFSQFQGRHVTAPLEYLDLVQTSCESIKARWDKHLYPLMSLELGNEPDIARAPWNEPEYMATYSVKAWRIIRGILGPNVTVITPGISNFDADSIQWLDRYLEAVWREHRGFLGDGLGNDPFLVIGLHRYPVANDSQVPHIGRTREEELSAITRTIGERRFWITETGLTEGPHKVKRPAPWCWIPKREYLTPELTAARIASDLVWWAKQEVEVVTLYQINDGPDRNDPLHHYGLRDIHDAWKALFHLLPATRIAMDNTAA